MQIVEEQLATVETASAYQVDDVLIVRLAGSKPTACHVVTVERSLTDVEPPAFVARLATDPRVRCTDAIARYEVAQGFRTGAPRDEVHVHHSGDVMTVPVQQVTVDGAVDGLDRGLGGGADRGRTPAATGSPLLPLDPGGEPREEFGFSRAYDLGEAVKDAIAKLPPRGANIPDWLNTYAVVALDVEIGGIAGFDHLRVTVRG